jgi:hypothetical protein
VRFWGQKFPLIGPDKTLGPTLKYLPTSRLGGEFIKLALRSATSASLQKVSWQS